MAERAVEHVQGVLKVGGAIEPVIDGQNRPRHTAGHIRLAAAHYQAGQHTDCLLTRSEPGSHRRATAGVYSCPLSLSETVHCQVRGTRAQRGSPT